MSHVYVNRFAEAMSHLQKLARGPVDCEFAQAGRRALAARDRHQAEARAAEQQAARKKVAEALSIGRDYLEERRHERAVFEAKHTAQCVAREIAADKSRAKAERQKFNRYLQKIRTACALAPARPVAPAPRPVQQLTAPVAEPVPTVAALTELKTLAEIGRQASINAEQQRIKYSFELFADASVCEPPTPFRLDRRARLRF